MSDETRYILFIVGEPDIPNFNLPYLCKVAHQRISVGDPFFYISANDIRISVGEGVTNKIIGREVSKNVKNQLVKGRDIDIIVTIPTITPEWLRSTLSPPDFDNSSLEVTVLEIEPGTVKGDITTIAKSVKHVKIDPEQLKEAV